MKFRLPWETRSESYTDVVVAQILANAGGVDPAKASATAALEAVSGLVSRAFAVAEVTAPDAIKAALGPSTLALIGRSLIRVGEIIFAIEVDGGELELRPAHSHSLTGGSQRSAWRYDLSLAGPSSETVRESLPAAAVVHLQYASNSGTPWIGYGPMVAASLAGRLSAETTKALADESSGAIGQLVPIPVGGQDSTVAGLKADLASKRGAAYLVEDGDWDANGGGRGAPWLPRRLGANPPASMVELAKHASNEVYAAAGVNPAIFTDSQGTAAREAYRQVLFGLIAPLGKLIAQELTAKLEAEISFDWVELRASDVSGRARAFQSLVGGGMPMAEAAQISGVLSPSA